MPMRVAISALTNNERVELWERAADMLPPQRAVALVSAYLSSQYEGDVVDWTLAGRDHFLLLAYRAEFGESIAVVCACSECTAKTQLSFTVSQVLASGSERLKSNTEATEINTEAYLPYYETLDTELGMAAFSGRFRLPIVRDLFVLASSNSPLSKPHTQSEFAQCVLDPASYRDVLSCIDKSEDAASAWRAFYLALEARMLEIEPLTIVSLNSACTECGAETAHQFDIANQFWSLLTSDVERQLWDVHLLASAYGWSSHDILAMSPARRRQHIAMVIDS
ncbi:hypothetical protein LRP50_09580 [Enterovibrio sp. ZSDZ42]|uniref:Uncharacterized protein n=1 Tax=Enterovibrio gelatinilyticus TaxID=2899819 RepID=A0ABT5R0U1_9GAMM|nr:hypothetical protein [Enterovibrio sp. ZSDZ42]MDD1793376.1 hypothetical protein [Enterovibrio sp. ZSDZ42]